MMRAVRDGGRCTASSSRRSKSDDSRWTQGALQRTQSSNHELCSNSPVPVSLASRSLPAPVPALAPFFPRIRTAANAERLQKKLTLALSMFPHAQIQDWKGS